jgi:aspartyl protease family protein
MKGLIALALFLVAALLLAGQLAAPVHPLDGAATQAAAAARPAPTAHFAGEALVVQRDGSGQFHIDADVNGARTRFLIDTGADTVALTVADAEAAGITVNPNGFVPILRTASGQGYGTLVTLDRFQLGDTELHNVGAVVVKDLGVSLLGQTVLGQMGRLELQGDRMVLEQRQ